MTQDKPRTAKQITSGKYQRLMALSDEHGGQPWWNLYGGRENLNVVASSHPGENGQNNQ